MKYPIIAYGDPVLTEIALPLDQNDYPDIKQLVNDMFCFKEGCLSIPGIMEDVYRKPQIKITYLDENWNIQEQNFEGIIARVIQHEYDHIEGKLFIDALSIQERLFYSNRIEQHIGWEYRSWLRNEISTPKVKLI